MTHPPWTCDCGTTDGWHAHDCPDAPATCGLCGANLIQADVAYCEGFELAYMVHDRDKTNLCTDCYETFRQLHCVTCGQLKPIQSVRDEADECPPCAEESAERLARKIARRAEWREQWLSGSGA